MAVSTVVQFSCDHTRCSNVATSGEATEGGAMVRVPRGWFHIKMTATSWQGGDKVDSHFCSHSHAMEHISNLLTPSAEARFTAE